MTNSVSLESNYCNPCPLVSYLPSFLAHLHKLDTYICFLQNYLMSTPRSHPFRVPYVQALAKGRMLRYWMLKDSDDLEQSILHFTEAIFLPLPWQGLSSNIIENILFPCACSCFPHQ